ncbi:MAG: aspartyl protease family protein [Sinomicrobium sp.]|nr:aspartyl protease family protein [Sinomicrobium sp.]
MLNNDRLQKGIYYIYFQTLFSTVLKRLYIAIFLIFFLSLCTYSQSGFRFSGGKEKETLRFRFINNLIIIPVEVNGVELSFVLDTGVNKPILFNLTDSDSLEVKNVEEIYIRGLGEGDPIRAFKSRGNRFKLKHYIYNNDQDLYIVLDEGINFSPRIGFPIHGIIGFDLFKDFVVEINYVQKFLRLYDPGTYRYKPCRKCEFFDLDFIQNKPYIDAVADMEKKDGIPVKLLIDSGSSDALWLFEDASKAIEVPEKYFEDFLGRGLSGSIYGKRSRVKNLHIGGFVLNQAKVAFPDSVSVKYIDLGGRNGSLGAEVLKRFNVIFDYRNKKISLKKNGKFKEPFKYNMSGIELQHNGIRLVKELESNIHGIVKDDENVHGGVKILLNERYKLSLHPAFEVAEIREKSPAAEAGLKKGDVIVSVNGKPTYRHSLQEVAEMLKEAEGKNIRLLVERDGLMLRFFFQLRKVL